MSRPQRRRDPYRRRRALALMVLLIVVVVVAVVVVHKVLDVNTHGARVMHVTVDSSLVHRTLTETAVIPKGDSGVRRPVLVFLHGKGEDESSNLDGPMFAALARLGSRAPDVVFPDGDEDSYWHDRESGAWGRYVIDEVIPQALRQLHADPQRIAIGGLSMGGFGAYDLARLYPGRFCAVGGDSPALWISGGESAAGAFDDAEDFTRHDVIGGAEKSADPYPGMKLWIDVGSEDPFRSADTTFARVLKEKGRPVQFHIWPGGHDQSYWQSHWDSYLGFYATALEHCHQA